MVHVVHLISSVKEVKLRHRSEVLDPRLKSGTSSSPFGPRTPPRARLRWAGAPEICPRLRDGPEAPGAGACRLRLERERRARTRTGCPRAVRPFRRRAAGKTEQPRTHILPKAGLSPGSSNRCHSGHKSNRPRTRPPLSAGFLRGTKAGASTTYSITRPWLWIGACSSRRCTPPWCSRIQGARNRTRARGTPSPRPRPTPGGPAPRYTGPGVGPSSQTGPRVPRSSLLRQAWAPTPTKPKQQDHSSPRPSREPY